MVLSCATPHSHAVEQEQRCVPAATGPEFPGHSMQSAKGAHVVFCCSPGPRWIGDRVAQRLQSCPAQLDSPLSPFRLPWMSQMTGQHFRVVPSVPVHPKVAQSHQQPAIASSTLKELRQHLPSCVARSKQLSTPHLQARSHVGDSPAARINRAANVPAQNSMVNPMVCTQPYVSAGWFPALSVVVSLLGG